MFVHLHCHSHYSFLRGVTPPEEIIAAAVDQKMPAVALTDTNGLYAAVPFYQAAKAAGIKPIMGVTLDVEWPQDRREIPSDKIRTFGRSARNEGAVKNANSLAMVLLAADMEGNSNLCQLTTLRH
ncbi:MAG TPA: PHP domain-containing protein, partial [Candidatus Acidoferrum sp.]|nr:PHP domain-containing protein [Candidatus Acidoferrum sp.]